MTSVQKTRVEWSAGGPLVGRRRAVAALRTRIERALAGEPGVVLLEGAPGVGKSRLILEARAIAGPDATFVSSRFLAGSPRALEPIVDAVLPALREAGVLAAPELGGHAGVLNDLVEGRFPERADWLQSSGDRVRPALLAAVERWTAGDTVVFAFDDVQWADDASVVVLEHLVLGVLDASLRRGQHACFILALQDVAEGPVARLVTRLRSQAATVALHLQGLSEVETASLVRNGTGAQCPPQLLRRVHEATGGNPLIVSELFRRSGAVGAAGLELPEHARIPASALETARAALATLEPEVRLALAAASTWYGPFRAEDVATVLGQPPSSVESALDSASRQGVIAPEGDNGYEFAVPAMREAAVLAVSPGEAATWHHAIATMLRDSGRRQPGRIAHHLLAAGSLASKDERAAAFLDAANDAFARRAYGDAGLWYERGLPPDDELAPGHATAELLLRCAIAHQRNMDVAASERRFRQALAWCRECDDTEGWGHALMGLMRAAMAHGEVPTGRHPYEEEYRQFLDEAAGDVATVAAVMASWANGLHFVGSRDAAAVAQEALEKAQQCGSPFAEVLARVALGLAAMAELDGETAEYQNRRGLEAAERMDDPWFRCWSLQNLAPSLLLSGKVAAARDAVEQTRRAARTAGNVAAEGFANAYGVAIAATCGDFDEADVAADAGLALFERSSNTQIAWVLLPALAAMRAWCGDYAGAASAAARLAEHSPRVAGTVLGYAEALSGRGAGEVRPPGAGPVLDAGRLFNLTTRLDALAWCDEMPPSPAVRQLLEAVIELGTTFSQSPCFSLERLLAELLWAEGDTEGAGATIDAAVAACETAGAMVELSRCHLARARWLVERGDPEAALGALEAASAIAAECGAAAVSDQCATLGQRLGLDTAADAAAPPMARNRPLDVLVEWAAGQSTTEIARALLLERSVVEQALDEARATYGTNTRAEAAALLARLGVGDTAGRTASAVFLFTDIVDSTPANVRLGDTLWVEIVNLHDVRIRESVEANDGRVIKTMGDGTFAVFESVEASVRAAIAIRARPPPRVPGHPTLRLLDRVGIHAGTAVAVDDDYLGLAVTVTSRLCGLATGKQVLLSEPVRRGLPPELAARVLDRGRVGLKGLAGRMRVFELADRSA